MREPHNVNPRTAHSKKKNDKMIRNTKRTKSIFLTRRRKKDPGNMQNRARTQIAFFYLVKNTLKEKGNTRSSSRKRQIDEHRRQETTQTRPHKDFQHDKTLHEHGSIMPKSSDLRLFGTPKSPCVGEERRAGLGQAKPSQLDPPIVRSRTSQYS